MDVSSYVLPSPDCLGHYSGYSELVFASGRGNMALTTTMHWPQRCMHVSQQQTPSELTARAGGLLWRREKQGATSSVPLPIAGLLQVLVFGLRKERRLK